MMKTRKWRCEAGFLISSTTVGMPKILSDIRPYSILLLILLTAETLIAQTISHQHLHHLLSSSDPC